MHATCLQRHTSSPNTREDGYVCLCLLLLTGICSSSCTRGDMSSWHIINGPNFLHYFPNHFHLLPRGFGINSQVIKLNNYVVQLIGSFTIFLLLNNISHDAHFSTRQNMEPEESLEKKIKFFSSQVFQIFDSKHGSSENYSDFFFLLLLLLPDLGLCVLRAITS